MLAELDWIPVSRLLLLHITETPFLLLYPTTAITAQGQTLGGLERFCVSTKSLMSGTWSP